MYFWLADYEYKMDQEHYIVETISNRQKFCYFLVHGNDFKKTSIILGDAFLRGYYVYHDVTNREIGMFGDYMLYYGPKIKYLWIKIGLAFFFVFVFIITVCCLYYCCLCRGGSAKHHEQQPLVNERKDRSDKVRKEKKGRYLVKLNPWV